MYKLQLLSGIPTDPSTVQISEVYRETTIHEDDLHCSKIAASLRPQLQSALYITTTLVYTSGPNEYIHLKIEKRRLKKSNFIKVLYHYRV